MNVSRSGYYKWLKSKDKFNNYEKNRRDLGELIIEIHKKKPSYGYRRINAIILREVGFVASNNLIHKICKSLNIKSRAKHYKKYVKPGIESIKYPNIIKSDWKTEKPLEKVVTDTTTIWFRKKLYDWTYYVDVFNNEIIGSDISIYCYGNNPSNHKLALKEMLKSKTKRGYKTQDTIMHSDQGAIYSSYALSQVHKNYNIIRSMSRVGTPTDNAVIESKNGWLKKEIYIDFKQEDYINVQEYIEDIINDHNSYRPSYALNYKTPIEYRTQLGFK